jgi:hypothetical protein
VLLTAALCVPAGIVMIFAGLDAIDYGGGRRISPFMFGLVIFAAAFGVAAIVVKLLSKYVAMESSGTLHAGPITIGTCAGIFASLSIASAMPVLPLLAALPAVGALVGSFVRRSVSPPIAGTVSGILSVICAASRL